MSGKSPRQKIAEALGVSDETVLRELSTADFSAVEKTVGKDGKASRTMQPRLLPAIAPIAEDDTLTVDELLRLPDDEDDRKLPDEDEAQA
jgi:ABC-type polysaccharide/polyol phosphate transport system ATPase subunit